MKSINGGASSTLAGWRSKLEAASRKLEADPYLSIPPAVRAAYDDSHTPFVIFGTTDFALAILPHLRARRSVTHFVDDFRAGTEIEGIPVIDSGTFLLRAARQTTLAVNCSRYDRGIRHFVELARHANVPCLNFEQAVRLLQLGDAIDYRLSDWGPSITGRLDLFLDVGTRFDDTLSQDTFFAVLLSHISSVRLIFEQIQLVGGVR